MAWSRAATGSDNLHGRPSCLAPPEAMRVAGHANPERSTMLYLTAVVALAALVYLTYAMIRPEQF